MAAVCPNLLPRVARRAVCNGGSWVSSSHFPPLHTRFLQSDQTALVRAHTLFGDYAHNQDLGVLHFNVGLWNNILRGLDTK